MFDLEFIYEIYNNRLYIYTIYKMHTIRINEYNNVKYKIKINSNNDTLHPTHLPNSHPLSTLLFCFYNDIFSIYSHSPSPSLNKEFNK